MTYILSRRPIQPLQIARWLLNSDYKKKVFILDISGMVFVTYNGSTPVDIVLHSY